MLRQVMPYVFLGNAVSFTRSLSMSSGFEAVAVLRHQLFRVTALISKVSIFQLTDSSLIRDQGLFWTLQFMLSGIILLSGS